MGELADRLDGMTVRVTLPDGSLSAELVGSRAVTVSFPPGEYGRMPEPELARRLAQLARLLVARRTPEYFRIQSEVTGETTTKEPPAIGRRDQEYAAARDDVVAKGLSVDGRIQVSVRGMREWTVWIRPGTLRSLSEDQFVGAVGEAAGDLIADQRDRIRAVAVQVYR
ncbi:hypothetical protein [Cryptosporangium sp. NPDC051539]|uniref:hypothetical protein n=1 Tax=Cryptosporangium sp. NPDC051539 TaxID=3363962 RepID=UPI0037BDE7F8